jgi:hypothetical protein
VRADLGKALVCLPLLYTCVYMPDLCHYPASLNMCVMCDRVLSVQQSDNTGNDVAARASPGIQVGLGLNKREVAASVYDFQPSFCACTICTAGRRSPSDADTSRFAKSPRPSLLLWCAVFMPCSPASGQIHASSLSRRRYLATSLAPPSPSSSGAAAS